MVPATGKGKGMQRRHSHVTQAQAWTWHPAGVAEVLVGSKQSLVTMAWTSFFCTDASVDSLVYPSLVQSGSRGRRASWGGVVVSFPISSRVTSPRSPHPCSSLGCRRLKCSFPLSMNGGASSLWKVSLLSSQTESKT